ncbi:MAG: hypothetical protein ABIT16_02615 [Croceibacterium sp.]
MKRLIAIGLLLACAACSQDDAPVDDIAKTAEQIVDPSASDTSALARGRYAPQDNCSTVEGADEFRRALAAAVKARDVNALVGLSAVDIKLDFGGGAGTAELRNRLNDKSRDLWSELDEVLALGCSANDQGGITMPWFFDQTIAAPDPTSGMLVTGEDVPVLSDPSPTSKVLSTVSWDVVKIATLKPEDDYQQIELSDKTVGFIATDKLRSLLDYRLVASSRNDKWSITSFLAGD